jgi:teichoic acid transport system permease protein
MNIVDIVSGTPYWVWVLFIYLLVRGIYGLQTRAVDIHKLAIPPAIFVVWSLVSLYRKCISCPTLLLYWLVAYACGLFCMYYITARSHYIVDTKEKTIILPGSIMPLATTMIFFLSKYILGVTYALYPDLKINMYLMMIDMLISGIISGVSIGRFIALVKTYKNSVQIS